MSMLQANDIVTHVCTVRVNLNLITNWIYITLRLIDSDQTS